MKFVYASGVLLIGALFVFFLSGDEVPDIRPFPQELSDEPDAVMHNFDVSQFDAEGEKLFELKAEKAHYYADGGYSKVTHLNVVLSTEEKGHWHLTATEGTFEEHVKDSQLMLKGDVIMWTEGLQPTSQFRFQTDALRVLPEYQYAESLSTVIMTTHNSKIHAGRVEIDLEPRSVRFSSTSTSQVELLISLDV